jgi:uncharacterized protein
MDHRKTINWTNVCAGPRSIAMAAAIWLGLLGIGAGVLTTVAGIGGGLVLVLVLGLVWDPVTALACTAPALLLGNLHRMLLYRRSVNWGVARAFAAGALPGAVGGALLMVAVPRLLIEVTLLVLTVTSLGIALAKLTLRPPNVAMTPAGFFIGGLTGTSGGAGMLVAPLFLSSGLAGDSYVGTSAMSGVVLHLGRIAGYGADGLFDLRRVGFAAAIGVGLISGNFLGRRLRALTARLPPSSVEHAALVVMVLLALAGIGR